MKKEEVRSLDHVQAAHVRIGAHHLNLNSIRCLSSQCQFQKAVGYGVPTKMLNQRSIQIGGK